MTISVKPDTKDRWDELKPDDMTHNEFAQEVLDQYQHGDEPVMIDTEAIIEEAATSIASKCEVAAFRGCKEYHE